MMKQWIRFLCLSLLSIVAGMASAQNVAKIGDTEYATLQAAFNEATDGQTVTLLGDYDANEDMAGGTRQFVIKKNITFDGGGHTLTTKQRGIGIGNVNNDLTANINVTIKNITILNQSKGARCIDTRGKIGSLTLEGVTLSTDGAASGDYTQPLTIGGNQSNAATVNITNSTIQTNEDGTAYYAITTFNPVNMTIENSTIKGWACIYAKAANSSAGSAGSTIGIDSSNLVSSNAYSGVSNAFSAFMMEDDNVNINVTNSEITINNTGDQQQTVVGYNSNSLSGLVTLGDGNTVTFAGPNDCELLLNGSKANISLTGGTYNFDPSEYLAEGYKAVKENGTWTVKEIVYVAQIGVTKYESLAEAVAAANTGDVIEIIKADDYKLPNLPNNVTIEGAVEGVNIDANVPYGGSIASVPNGATFKNLTFNWNDVNYHGFQHAGTINMENCKHNGRFFSYGNMNFTNCEFEYSGDEYCMWVYGAGEVVYDKCTFTNKTLGKLLHFYCEDPNLQHKVTVRDCKFVNEEISDKSAINVKATSGSNALQYELRLEGINTYEGNFPTVVGEQATARKTWILSPLVQVDDRKVSPDNIKVYENNVLIYPVSYVAQIGDVKYESLAKAVAAAQDGQTITILTDIDLPSTIAVTKQVTLDLAGKTISNTSDLWAGGNWSFFSVQATGNLTVTGNGTIDAKENDCFTFDVRDGGILTIKDGTFTGNISSVYLINEAGTGVSTCNIEGGTFSIKQIDGTGGYNFLLNCLDASYKNNTAKFNVTGGSFVNFNPANNLAEGAETNFCAAGYEAVQDGDVWTVQKAPVAQIGDVKYTSLAEAFTAATDGQTITVLTDIDLPSTIAVTKQVTLDLDGKKIFNTSDLWVDGNWSFFSVQAGGNLTVTGDGTIDAKENDCYTFDVRNGGVLTIKDGTFTGNISCVYLTNEAGTGVSTCNIEGGTFSIKQLANNVQDDKYRYLLNCHDASYASNTTKFNVTGGSFVNFNPANNLAEGAETNFCAAGYEAVQDGNVWTVQKAPVAKIGETVYYSLASAIAAVPTDGTKTTITLLADVTENAVVKDGKNIVLDLGEKTLTGYVDQYDSQLTVKNGTITGTVYVNGGAENTENYNKFTLDATATIIAKDYGIILWQSDKNTAYGSTIDINGTINGCVFVMGNIKEGNSVINVNDGATIKGEVGIALNGYATLNVVDGATIEGTVDSGIEVRAGKLNVTGGKISSTASEYAVNPNGSGTTTTGAAIAVAQHTTKLATDVVISGGELSGVKTISVADPQNNNLDGVTVKVADALVNVETVVIPEGYKWVSADGMSTLTKKEYVAQIGETQYETLADAVAAATAETTTITLLKDVKEGIVVKDGKNIVLDLNGKTMTGYINQYDSEILVQNGTLAGTVYVNGGPASAESGYNKFTLAEDATINADWGFILYQGPNGNDAYGSVIDINGTVNGTAWVMGNIHEGNSVINVNSGAKIKGSVFGLNGYATLNVKEGATIIGSETGIEVRAGKLNVMGGTITSTASEYTVVPNGSGTTTTGAAIAVAQHTTSLATEVKISGGEFAGVKSLAIVNPQNNTAENVKVAVSGGKFNGDLEVSDTRVTKFVSGGIYSQKPDEKYCAEGYIVTNNTDEATKEQYPYTVKSKEEAGIYELDDVKDQEAYPYPNGATATKVTYTRTFSEDNVDKPQSWLVPFDYTITTDDEEYMQFYKIDLIAPAASAEGEVQDNTAVYIYIEKVNAGTVLRANKPYVVKPKSGVQDYVFVAENINKLYPVDNTSRLRHQTTQFFYDFYATFKKELFAEPEQVWFMKGGKIVRNGKNNRLRTYRWYIKPTSTGYGDDYAKPNLFIVDDDSETDGIGNNEVIYGEIQGIYTLGGIKVEHLVKGVNIIKYTDGRTKKINVK